MSLLVYLFKKYPLTGFKLILLALGLGAALSLLMHGVNNVMDALMAGQSALPPVSMSFLALSVLYFLYPAFNKTGSGLFKKALIDLKTAIIDKYSRISLLDFENIGQERFFQVLDFQFQNLSFMSYFPAVLLLTLAQWLLVLLYSAFFLSPALTSAILILTLVAQASVFFVSRNQKEQSEKIKGYQDKFHLSMGHFIYGFKELKVNYAKGQDLLKEQADNLKALHEALPPYLGSRDTNLYSIKTLYFTLMLAIVCVLPAALQLDAAETIKMATTAMFVFMPVLGLTLFVNEMKSVTAIFDDVLAFDRELAGKLKQGGKNNQKPHEPLAFESELIVHEAVFAYPSRKGTQQYELGPIEMRIAKGETVFIIGGNGSGKSTLLKVLTGLYPLAYGKITVDGTEVMPSGIGDYQELFSAVFTDFHIPKEIRGVETKDMERAKKLLKVLHLEHKTKIEDGVISDLGLSTGQRKRLAMLIAFLENKQIYVFDEVAADQDPDHRKYFYEFILPDMKKAGKTLIVVTHDEHYFHLADRVLKMEAGTLS